MRKFWSKRDNHATAGPTCDDLKQHVEEGKPFLVPVSIAQHGITVDECLAGAKLLKFLRFMMNNRDPIASERLGDEREVLLKYGAVPFDAMVSDRVRKERKQRGLPETGLGPQSGDTQGEAAWGGAERGAEATPP